MTDKTHNAYHFVGATLRDGQPVPEDGVTLVHSGPLVMCQSGLHASRTAWAALKYAPGPVLCRDICEFIQTEDNDKLVCSERTIIDRRDATKMLRKFARTCALDVAHLWDVPPVVLRYLKTGDGSARVAAWAAARAAARDAARDAGAAAGTAAWDAAWVAAWDAAWVAARVAARAAEEAWQFDRLIAWFSDDEPQVWPLPVRDAEAA